MAEMRFQPRCLACVPITVPLVGALFIPAVCVLRWPSLTPAVELWATSFPMTDPVVLQVRAQTLFYLNTLI